MLRAPSDVVALEVRHYGHQPGASRLYDDDGETFDYEHGERTWTRLVATRDASGAWTGQVTPDAQRQGLALLAGLLDVHDAEPLDALRRRELPGRLHAIGNQLL